MREAKKKGYNVGISDNYPSQTPVSNNLEVSDTRI